MTSPIRIAIPPENVAGTSLVGDNIFGVTNPTFVSSPLPENYNISDWENSFVWYEFTGDLFTDGITYTDVYQGELGDCYLMAALAEVAEHSPETISSIIEVNSDSSQPNTYTISNLGGLDNTFVIDNQLPFQNDVYSIDGNRYYPEEYIYADAQYEGWVGLIEKGYAYLNSIEDLRGASNYYPGENSYQTIINGDAGGALSDLTGLEYSWENITDLSDSEIHSRLTADRPTILSMVAPGKKKADGSNHAYGVLGYQEDTNTYRFFNPWGIGNDEDGGYLDLNIAQIRETGLNIYYTDSLSFSLDDNTVSNILQAPDDVLIYSIPEQVKIGSDLTISDIWVRDLNGSNDLQRVEFWLEDDAQNSLQLSSSQFAPWDENPLWANVSDISFSASDVEEFATNDNSSYTLNVRAYDSAGLASDIFDWNIELVNNFAPDSLLIYEVPTQLAAGENLEIGQIYASDPDGWQDIQYIDYWMWDSEGNLIELPDSTEFTQWEDSDVWASTNNMVFTPEEFAGGVGGEYTFAAQVYDASGEVGEYLSWDILIEGDNNQPSLDITTYQITDNEKDDRNPLVSEYGDIVWEHQYGESDTDLYYHDYLGENSEIATNTINENNANISALGNVVFEKHLSGEDTDIGYYDYATETTTTIANSLNHETNPQIDGVNIVYEYRYGINDRDIYLYNSDTQETTTVAGSTSDQFNPQIAGNYIFYSEDVEVVRGTQLYDHYLYDITTGESSLILGDRDVQQGEAKLSAEGHIVYPVLYDPEGISLRLYDNYTGDTINLVTGMDATNPKIAGNYATWQASDGNDLEIYRYDHNTGDTIQLTDNEVDDVNPVICDRGYVVWEHQYSSEDTDIYLHTGTREYILANTIYNETNPDIFGTQVTWQGWDGSDWEIYSAEIVDV